MKRVLRWFLISAFSFIGIGLAHSATLSVKQDGTGDATTVQAALNAASEGDIIEIGDNETYVEDVTVSPVLSQAGIPAAPLSSFTLQAADGMHPTIQAANLETSQRMSAIGVPGRDLLGFVVWGCKGVTIKGIEFVNPLNEVNSFNVQSILVIVDCADITIEDCVIRGSGAASPGEGNGILIAGVQAQPHKTDNVNILNCEITDTHYGIISAQFQKGAGADPVHVTIDNCSFRNGFESGVDIDNAEEAVIRNCHFDNYNHGVHFAGGNTIVEDCTIINSKHEGIESQVDTNWNDSISGGVIRRCAIISNGLENQSAGIRCTDGPITIEHCIIAGSGGPGIEVTTGGAMDVSVIVNHCDIYENFGEGDVMVIKDGDHNAELTITNSNIVSTGSGILNYDLPGAVTAQYNNVFVDGDAYIGVEPQDSISVDPGYESPEFESDSFSLEGFRLQKSSPVLTAGMNETPIGSQGTGETNIKAWMLF